MAARCGWSWSTIDAQTREEGRKRDCQADCRRYAGFDTVTCEEIDEERIAIYRHCVDNSDFILCGE